MGDQRDIENVHKIIDQLMESFLNGDGLPLYALIGKV